MQREDEKLQKMLSEKLGMHYALENDYSVSLLKYSENYNWLIQSGDAKYVLRLCRKGYHTKEELLGELLWIQELEQAADIRMPVIIRNKEGGLLSRIEDFDCTMFSFLKGTTLREIEGERLLYYLKEIGKIAGKLHEQVSRWNAANDLKRFTWNFEDLMGKQARVGDWRLHPGLSKEEKQLYEKAEAIICKRLQQYGKTKDNYGLIHSDLNINNVLVYDDVVQVIDFDDCGFGWFLYDLSTSVLEYDADIQKKINAWLDGYEEIRKLSNEDRAMIPTFIVMRKIVRIGWIASHMENDTVKKVTKRYYEQTCQMAKEYVESNGDSF